MRHAVSPAQCRARSLPDASFSLSAQGMHAGATVDAYLTGGGPPGGTLWFAALPAHGQGVAALEPALRRRLGGGAQIAPSNLTIAGAVRPCLAAVAGDGYARVTAFAALLLDPRRCPGGVVLLGACTAAPNAAPSVEAALANPSLRELVSSFTFDDPNAEPLPAPEASAWIELDGPGGLSRHGLGAARVVLGRSPNADIAVHDEKLSRQHAVVERRADGYALRVLGSANGVEVHGALRAEGMFPLASGDIFVIGDTRVRLTVMPGEAPRPVSQRHAAVDAFFGALGLPPPPIPQGVYVVATPGGVATTTPPGPFGPITGALAGPQLAIALPEGRGIEGFSFRWSSRAWSVTLDGKSFGASTLAPSRAQATFTALACVLVDAMAYEGTLAPPGEVRHMYVRAADPSGAAWTTPFGVEIASDDAHAALLEALAWRRANRL